MARVTVEDCIDKVTNRFELVLLASHRARALHNGDEATVPIDNDKTPVVALREIAEETLVINEIKEDFIKSLQFYQEDENVDETLSSAIKVFRKYRYVTVEELINYFHPLYILVFSHVHVAKCFRKLPPSLHHVISQDPPAQAIACSKCVLSSSSVHSV